MTSFSGSYTAELTLSAAFTVPVNIISVDDSLTPDDTTVHPEVFAVSSSFSSAQLAVTSFTNVCKSFLLTCNNVPIAVLGTVLLFFGHIPGGWLPLEEALYHQQQTKQEKSKPHVFSELTRDVQNKVNSQTFSATKSSTSLHLRAKYCNFTLLRWFNSLSYLFPHYMQRDSIKTYWLG